MKAGWIALFFCLSLGAARAEQSHAFLDGFVVTVGKGYEVAVDDAEDSLTVAAPGGVRLAGRIFYNKASEAQEFDRDEYMKRYARNFLADKIREKPPLGAEVDITVTAVEGRSDLQAFLVVLKTADKREYAALAIDLTPSPGMASLMLLRVETGRPSSHKAVLNRLLANFAIVFLDAAG